MNMMSDLRTDGLDARENARKRIPKGRKDSTGQEAVINKQVINERALELIELHDKAVSAAGAYSDAINKAAEDSGYNAAAVRKYVTARANDKFEAEKRKVWQQASIFDIPLVEKPTTEDADDE